MRRHKWIYLPLLFILILFAALSHAQQQPAPVLSRQADPLVGDINETDPGQSLPGDPFGTGTRGDPFANESAFDGEATDGDALPANATITSGKQCRADLHGYLESRNRVRIPKGDVISTRQRLWLEADGFFPLGDTFGNALPLRFFASAALDIDPAAADLSTDHSLTHAYMQEAFVTIDTDRLDVVLGRKMLRWGTGDGINPLDLINPLDFREPVASGRADARVPVVLGQAITRLPTVGPLQEATLEGVLVPLARVNRLNHPGSVWESPGLRALRTAEAREDLLLEDQQRPGHPLQDAEFGLRLAATLSGWDLALIGFYGHIDSPVYARDVASLGNGRDLFRLTPIHPTFSALGINFAKGLDRSTFRGELSVKPDLPVMLADDGAIPGYARHTVVEGVLGVDRTFGANFYTNFQYFFTVTDNADELVRDAFDHGLSYDISDKFLQDDLEAGARGIVSFSDQGWTCELYAEYSLGDDWLLAASLFFFEGSESGTYGQYNDNDSVTVRLRRSF